MVRYYADQKKRFTEKAKDSSTVADVMDKKEETNALITLMYPLFLMFARQAWVNKNRQYGVSEAYPEAEIAKNTRAYVTKFATEINNTTFEHLSKILSAQKSIVKKDFSSDIGDYFDTNTRPRAKGMSSSETNGIIGLVGLMLFLSLKKNGKANHRSWLTTRDTKVRPSHKHADGQTIEITAKYNIDGSLARYPGDPQFPMEERAGCRCTEIIVD